MNYRNFFQAFQQAPWRVQLQKIGLFLLILVGVALVAGMYLSITASTYEAGVEVQSQENDNEEIRRNIEDTKTNKALLSASTEMQKRAEKLGYEKQEPYGYVYIMVPEYYGRQLDILNSPLPTAPEQILIKPEYRQSLWEYMFQGALAFSENSGGWPE